VGPRRIGKTWLISYLQLSAPSQLGSRYHVGLVDASLPRCASITGFTARVLEAFGVPAAASRSQNGLDALEDLVLEMKARRQVPVLCLDEFEAFGDHHTFQLSFFAGLRALTQAGLVLVVASKHPLIEIVGDYGRTSGLFNVFEQLTLKPFTPQEVERFARDKSAQARFTPAEYARLLHYGQAWPVRLQLVGKLLQEDQALAHGVDATYYRPEDQSYWDEFEERLEVIYRGVVRS
jgi:hypothetical protein